MSQETGSLPWVVHQANQDRPFESVEASRRWSYFPEILYSDCSRGGLQAPIKRPKVQSPQLGPGMPQCSVRLREEVPSQEKGPGGCSEQPRQL